MPIQFSPAIFRSENFFTLRLVNRETCLKILSPILSPPPIRTCVYTPTDAAADAAVCIGGLIPFFLELDTHCMGGMYLSFGTPSLGKSESR